MNKIVTLAILSTTLALGAVSAEAATRYHKAPATQTVVEGRNATENLAARNGDAAIREQVEGNLRSAN
ncbi:hypothetical protein KHC23_15090 [Ancylobacter dichloromethanicus]|uniref:Phage infection protein n=1 Tax=Ancylobacter dichloromethanicus TaxID=518825 RepID=A0A9W6JCS9_9HYPH|nr:hypothetical protein [Ancylobacter dichloromethanicus]MBS7554973.1 hypothetical protein [Ancylobacter dichloromethanicus]GLK73369.1 hypothetical protein GCM10017643_34860 [Ancylobacter dichloromethanicus]